MDTVKGAGIPEVEQLPMNHSIAVDDAQYAKWTADLKAQLNELEG